MENKITNKIALEFVLGLEDVKANAEIFDKLQKMLIQVEKKNSSVGKDGEKILSKTQKENEILKQIILDEMDKLSSPIQIKDLVLMNVFKEKGVSNQKLSALIKQLVEDNFVVRIEEKRVAKFKVV